MSIMRVLFASNYPHMPDITGGLQTTTHDLCLAINALGAEAAVLCGRSERTDHSGGVLHLLTHDESLGYLVLRSDAPEHALPQAAATWDASVVVVQSGMALLPMIGSSLASGRSTVVYLHNVETHQLAGNLAPDPSLLYLANSTFTAERWRALYGIDCAVVPPVVAPDRCIAHQVGTKVLFVNPTPIKGVEIMFALAQACPELQFLVVESWSLDERWRVYCQQRAAQLGNIEWRGPAHDIREVFAQSCVLLMPSVWEESFGRTAIEAQLNGLPVLGSNRGALPQLIGGGGLTLDPHAPGADWACALRLLHSPETRTPYAVAARRQAIAYVAETPLVVARFLSLAALHSQR
jgi:glycosyltransferase involved in cell wall biosynthesis